VRQCKVPGEWQTMDMGWTGHYVRMDAGKLANRAEVGKHQGCMSTEQAG